MKLSDEMNAELERRLTLAERERADDPAFADLPRADGIALLLLLAVSLVGVAIQQIL